MDKTEIMRQRLSDYIQQEGKTQSQVAKELTVSTATLSLFLSGNYSGDNDEIAKKVAQFLEIGSARKALVQEPGFCMELSNTRKILQLVQITHVSGDILLLYGAAGCGKTTALKHYSSTTNGVIHVEADVTTNSPRSILSMLLEAIAEPVQGATSNMMRVLIHKLSGTRQLIIIAKQPLEKKLTFTHQKLTLAKMRTPL